MTTTDYYFISVIANDDCQRKRLLHSQTLRLHHLNWTLCDLFYVLRRNIYCACDLHVTRRSLVFFFVFFFSLISLSVGHVSTTDGGELLMLFPSSS